MQHRGFDGLQNDTGILLITMAGFLFLAIIVAGGLFMRAKVMEERKVRAEQRRTSDENL